MSFISRTIWLFPFALHVGYAAAVFDQFPEIVGRSAKSDGTLAVRFYLLWFLVAAAANLAFCLLKGKLPKLNDKMLSVPASKVWLATPENREILFERLGAIVETALFGLNIFFLAVFQAIYQANVIRPVVALPLPVLLVGFMLAPLLMVGIHFTFVVHGLARRKGAQHPSDGFSDPTD